jgi:hypothetical protein
MFSNIQSLNHLLSHISPIPTIKQFLYDPFQQYSSIHAPALNLLASSNQTFWPYLISLSSCILRVPPTSHFALIAPVKTIATQFLLLGLVPLPAVLPSTYVSSQSPHFNVPSNTAMCDLAYRECMSAICTYCRLSNTLLLRIHWAAGFDIKIVISRPDQINP